MKFSRKNRYRQPPSIVNSRQFHSKHQRQFHNTVTTSSKQIIVLAGPSASGKSHFIDRLLDDNDQILKTNLFQQLGLQNGLKPGKLNIERLCNKKKMRRRSKKIMKDAFIVHFDFTSRNQRKRREQLKAIASEYKRLAVVTLELTFTTWNQRMSKRVKNNFFGMPLSQAFWICALSLIHKSYAHSLFNSVYEEWDSFLDQAAINDRFLFNTETSQFQSKSTTQTSNAS